ncbi:MAG: hypothetical protein VW378_01870 [bacterium]
MKKGTGNYSTLEYKIAKGLSKLPYLKRVLKKIYRICMVCIYCKKTRQIKTKKELIAVYPEGETFFGYYDHIPLNQTDEYCVFHQTEFDTSNKPKNKGINIMLKKMKTNEVFNIATSYAFNWQQGARLQWINENEIIFNNLNIKKQKLFSQIYNVKQKCFKTLDLPIYESCNTFSLTLNFERLNQYASDYGYCNYRKKLSQLKDDGVFILDHKRNKYSLLWSLDKISKVINIKYCSNNNQHINHIMLSPNARTCIFLHRIIVKGEVLHTLILGDLETRNLKILVSGMVSHCKWVDNENIVAYLKYKKEKGYFMINIKKNLIEKLKCNSIHTLGDGHPTVANNKMVIDTYPNRKQIKSLLLYYFDTNKLTTLTEAYEPLKFNGFSRCDLHPRLTNNGKQIWIDSTHTGKRMLYYLNLTE